MYIGTYVIYRFLVRLFSIFQERCICVYWGVARLRTHRAAVFGRYKFRNLSLCEVGDEAGAQCYVTRQRTPSFSVIYIYTIKHTVHTYISTFASSCGVNHPGASMKLVWWSTSILPPLTPRAVCACRLPHRLPRLPRPPPGPSGSPQRPDSRTASCWLGS